MDVKKIETAAIATPYATSIQPATFMEVTHTLPDLRADLWVWYVIPLNLESVTEIKPVVKAVETADKSAEKAKAAETVVTDDLRTIGHELMATVYAQFI